MRPYASGATPQYDAATWRLCASRGSAGRWEAAKSLGKRPMTTFTFDPAPFAQVLGATLGTYRLEQVLEVNELGPTYLARGGASNGAYRVRLLTSGADLSPQERAIYLQRVEELVGQIATLQHPNILPLIDYGTYR